MNVKQCTKCDELKPISEFGKHKLGKDGLRPCCKLCHCKQSKQWSKANPLKKKLQNRIYHRENRLKNRDKQIQHGREYRKENRASEANRLREWRRANKNKHQAHIAVRQAILKGELKKQTCRICNYADTEAHHCDYSKPLDILWFCKVHHAAWHKVFIAEGI